MKKITLILIATIAFVSVNAQSYTVPRGLFQDNTFNYHFKAPSGFVLFDSLIMFRSIADTQMKPLYPSLAYISNFAGDSTFWVWDMVRWKKLNSGGGGGGGTITDVTGTNNYGFEPIVTSPTSDTRDIQVSTLLTNGSVPFIGTNGALRENNSNLFWDSTNARLGISTNSPQANLQVGSPTITTISSSRVKIATEGVVYGSNNPSNINAGVMMVTANDVASGYSFYSGRRARGTITAPTAALSGDTLMRFGAGAYDGTQWQTWNSSAVNFVADGNFSTSSSPSHIGFSTTNTGSVIPQNRMTIASNGDVSINNLATTGTAPTTSGEIQMVVSDANGKLSFTGIDSVFPSSSPQWSVININNTPPVSPTTGDVYLAGTSPTGDFAGHANEIATWDGAAWGFQTAAASDQLYNQTNTIIYKYNGTTWSPLTRALIHQGGDAFGTDMRIGTTDAQFLRIRTNNANRITIQSNGTIFFNNLTGASLGLMGLTTTGSASNVQAGYGINITSNSIFIDTFAIPTRYTIDSLGGLISGSGVTSVGLTMPTGFSVSGSPVTSSGTLAVTTSLNGIVKGNGSGFGTVTVGSGLSYDGTTLSTTGGSGTNLGWIVVTSYGDTVGNGQISYAASISASSSTLTCTDCNFTSAVTGRVFNLKGAGVGGRELVGTITYVSSTQVTLSVAASTTVSGAKFMWGSDNTASIQAAINDAITQNKRVVYFPSGIYPIAGALQTSVGSVNPNCQIYIPSTVSKGDSARGQLILLGQSGPTSTPNGLAYNFTPPRTGTILWSTLKDSSGTAPSVFGALGVSTMGNSEVRQDVQVKNMTLMVNGNTGGNGPTIGGFNFGHLSTAVFEDVLVTSNQSVLNSIAPTNEVAAIIMPQQDYEHSSTMTRTMVSGGFKYGIATGEHLEMMSTSVYGCSRAFLVMKGLHSVHGDRVVIHWCNYAFYSPTTTTLGLTAGICYDLSIDNLDLEQYISSGAWYDQTFSVNDANAQIKGFIKYQPSKATVGYDATVWTVSGADSLKYTLDNHPWSNMSDAAVNQPNVVTSTINGLLLNNPTPSTVSTVKQYAPVLKFQGSAWDNDDAVNREASWILQDVTANGNTVSSTLSFQSKIDASTTIPMTLTSAGALSTTGNITAGTSGASSVIGTAFGGVTNVTFSASATTGSFVYQMGAVNMAKFYASSGNFGVQGLSGSGIIADQGATFFVEQNQLAIGTGTVTAGGTTVTGTGTFFLNQFKIGDQITLEPGASAETQTITAIASNTSMTTTAWTNAHTAKTIQVAAAKPVFAVRGNGLIGFGAVPSPSTATAFLNLPAGTANYAPINIPSGTNTTTAAAGNLEYNGTNLLFTRTGTTRESVITANSVNTVSPTSPNRTITVVIDGVTYYLAAKTTND